MFETEDGRRYLAFRHLALRGCRGGEPAVFVVRFEFARFSQGVNRLLSLIPIPLIGGFPGFRDKLWMVHEGASGWQGVYEWESAEDAEAYRRSFVLGLMTRRAVPESISYTLLPQARLLDYIEKRGQGKPV